MAALWLGILPARAGLPGFQQVGNTLLMSNANVRVEYNLGTGKTDFLWKNSRKITGFYAGVGLANYITGTIYPTRSWSQTGSNQVFVVSSGNGLPVMKQFFILDQDNAFLTRVTIESPDTNSNWMGPVVVDSRGGVDLGVYSDNRALVVPFDNDHWARYNDMPINNIGNGYEVAAFFDNASRNGLVVGSVSHDTWKSGIYFVGSNNRLDKMNVYGGACSQSATYDVLPHGAVTGTNISSPWVFVGFGEDWRIVLESFADANAARAPKLPWAGGVPFGWNSWFAYASSVTYDKAIAVSDFIRTSLQTNGFNNRGVVYVNLDSYWDNFSDAQLADFVRHCHANGQKAGIYWSPFVWWGSPANLTNSPVEGSSYKYKDVALRTPGGVVQTNDGAIAMDPTHPGIRQRTDYYLNNFIAKGFDYIKLDFLTHGALEGVHYDSRVTTGIQAYNQGMQYILGRLNGRMFISQSIAPIFPSGYAHSRRIACDTADSIGDTEYEMQSVSYGWWINGRLYEFSDPDLVKFAGVTANENQSRLISGAISGTLFLNSDDLASTTGQNLARLCLTNAGINEVARAGVSFRPVEGNTGTSASDVFVRQEGSTWYVAVFNYTASSVNKSLTLSRLGLAGTYTVLDLWSGTLSTVSGPAWTVSLGPRQAKLFRLGSGSVNAAGPADEVAWAGDTVTFTTTASGAPPFNYVWRRNGTLVGQNANTLTVGPVSPGDAGTYSVEVTGGIGRVTNRAGLTVSHGLGLQRGNTNLTLTWPSAHIGWRLQAQTNATGVGSSTSWSEMAGARVTNRWVVPLDAGNPGVFFRLSAPP